MKKWIMMFWLLSMGAASAQIFVERGNSSQYVVGKYTTSGAVINSSLIAGTYRDFGGIETSGSNLFLGNCDNNNVAEYTADGTLVNPAILKGTDPVAPLGSGNSPALILLSGSSLFVASSHYNAVNGYAYISEFTTSGQPVNPTLIKIPWEETCQGIGVSGSNIFALYTNTIVKYLLTGNTVSNPLIQGLTSPTALAVSGSYIYVANYGGTVSKYTTEGTLVNLSLITGLNHPTAIAVSGTDLYVANGYSGYSGSIGKYTTAGATVNASLITGLAYPTGLAVVQPVHTFAAFQAQYGLVNPDPTADPYHTGVSQLEAYAFGVNPAAPSRARLPSATLQNGYLQISYTRWKDATDLSYNVEVSDDLKNWYSGTNYAQEVSITPVDSTSEQVIVRDIVPNSSRHFIRVKITH